MFQATRTFKATVLAISLCLATAANAQTYRIPKTGEPALALAPLSGWPVQYDQYENLQFMAPDHSAFLQLSVISQAKDVALPDTAANVFKAAGAPPYTSTEPASIAGVPGEAFIDVVQSNGVSVNLRLVIVRLDDSHVGALSTAARSTLTPAQLASLKQMVARVSIEGR